MTTDVPFSFGGLVQATFMGAVSGAVTFGIGSLFANVGGFVLKASLSALAHGTFQGMMTGIQGGNFWNGFASGALSSIASSAWSGGDAGQWQGVGGKFAKSSVGIISFGTIAGGVGAELSGGNFWQGAVTGFIVSALNHAMHDGDNGYDENGNKINDKGGDETDYLYKDGNIIDSKPVAFKGAIPSNGGPLRGYGFRAIAMDTGAIQVDNSIFEWFAGGKIIGSFASSFKLLRGSGGKINGFSISKGAGYGAKPRFDFHKLVNPSKKSNSFPNWVKGKTLPHYHRGVGNNLHRHRPWENGWNDKSFWNRF